MPEELGLNFGGINMSDFSQHQFLQFIIQRNLHSNLANCESIWSKKSRIHNIFALLRMENSHELEFK